MKLLHIGTSSNNNIIVFYIKEIVQIKFRILNNTQF